MLDEIKNTITENIWKTKLPNPLYLSMPAIKTKSDVGKYFPKEIKDYIESHPSEKLTYRGTQPISYNVEFYCYEESIPLEKLQRQMKLVIWWLSTIQKYTNIRCDEMELQVYLTPFRKSLPFSSFDSIESGGSKHVLSAINCNTGFSTRCDMGNNIVIYRQEEWFKVFIHESFHYFGLDFAFSQTPELTNSLKRTFCVSPTIFLFESYTEFWAEMIVMLLYSKLHKKDLSIIIKKEIGHSLGQAKKVLLCQHLTYSDVLSPCNSRNRYQEDTNVFAYYVIKTIMLYYQEDFVRWCVENNPNLLRINPSELTSLFEWIKAHYNRPEFVSAVEGASVDGNGLRMTNINI